MGRLIAGKFALTDEAPRIGGLAAVHRAVDISCNPPRNVAVKIISPPDDDELVEVFFTKEVEALRRLTHPNVVRLLDAGRDADSEDAYIVLEWVESDLLTFLSDGPIPFDDFLDQIALPLAEALASAHEQQVIHRDVKPSNVLIDADGVPKLADFGISKIKSSLSASPHTTAQYMSRPYAPPEQESTSSYSRDVYGFGVLMLRCLSGIAMQDYPDVALALNGIDASSDLLDLIERCVDFDPSARPINGPLLYAELKTIQERRAAARDKSVTLPLAMGTKAREWFEAEFDLRGADLERYIVGDLVDAPALSPLTSREEAMGVDHDRHYFLYGSTLSYRVALRLEGPRPPCLFIMSAIKPDAGRLDRARDACFVLSSTDFRFTSPLNHAETRSNVREIVENADNFEEARLLAAEERERQRLLDEWRRQIAARESIESGRELPAKFKGVEINGRRLRLTVSEGLANVAIGEVRRIDGMSGKRRGPILRGEVERIDGDVITVYLDADPEAVPNAGQVLVDTTAARIKIDREKAALSDVAHASAKIVRRELRDLIIDPGSARVPVPQSLDVWFQDQLDQDKQAAVESALGNEDLFVVQGPPGTGKTTFITELVAQELKRDPKAIILIASQTNVALDNALSRIAKISPEARLIRLADAKAARVSEDAVPFLLDNQMEKWRKFVTARSQAFLDEWCSIHGVERDTVADALSLQELADLRFSHQGLSQELERTKRQAMQIERSANPAQREAESAELLEHRDEVRRQLQVVARDLAVVWQRLEAAGRTASLSDTSSPDEISAAASSLLEAAGGNADELKSFVRIQAEWLLRLGKGDEFVEPLLLGSQVLGATCVGLARYKALKSAEFSLCIIDEASKATATEALVPMVRAKRWVLVGDQRQLPPFQEEALGSPKVQEDYDLDSKELRRTLFDRLAENLPAECNFMLRTQRRMTVAIGRLISECFYDGALVSAGPEPIGPVAGVLPKPVTWLSTSRVRRRHEQTHQLDTVSYGNPEETREVVAALRRLARWYRPSADQKPLHVLLLAPYRAQVAQLRQRVAAIQADLLTLNIEVNTIDAVQGREADVVIFSVTRSNPENNLGFLGVEARANVALSRAKRGLLVVGDAEFCRSKPGPLRSIVEHIELHPEECVLEDIRP